MTRLFRIGAALAVVVLVSDAWLYGFERGYLIGLGWYKFLTRERNPVESNVVLEDYPCTRVVWQGDIEDRGLAESSGLTASVQHANVLWSINDSGNEAALFAMNVNGRDIGRWRVAARADYDWEALDSVVLDGNHYLIVGDVGDNFAVREHVNLLWIREPTDLSVREELTPVGVQRVSYPDGARDVEALAVDLERERILLASKREYPPVLYAVPLSVPDGTVAVVGSRAGTLAGIPQPTAEDFESNPTDGQHSHRPTGMDIWGSKLLVTTYRHAYLFDLQQLQTMPQRLPLPSIGQREALSFAAGSGRRAYITRERAYGYGAAEIFRVDFCD